MEKKTERRFFYFRFPFFVFFFLEAAHCCGGSLVFRYRVSLVGCSFFFPLILWKSMFYRVLPSFTEFRLALNDSADCTRFYLVLPGFTGLVLGFTMDYRVLPSFTGFYWVGTGFHHGLPSFTGFYWVLLGFTEFCRALPSFFLDLLRIFFVQNWTIF